MLMLGVFSFLANLLSPGRRELVGFVWAQVVMALQMFMVSLLLVLALWVLGVFQEHRTLTLLQLLPLLWPLLRWPRQEETQVSPPGATEAHLVVPHPQDSGQVLRLEPANVTVSRQYQTHLAALRVVRRAHDEVGESGTHTGTLAGVRDPEEFLMQQRYSVLVRLMHQDLVTQLTSHHLIVHHLHQRHCRPNKQHLVRMQITHKKKEECSPSLHTQNV